MRRLYPLLSLGKRKQKALMDSKELSRLKLMYKYEVEEFFKSRNLICGIDEAGRGPLAGPVVSSAVILPRLNSDNDFLECEGINDSKKISSKKRALLYNRLLENPNVYIGIGIVSERIIDKNNILRATRLSMCKAISNLDVKPDCLLIDGMFLPNVKIPQKKIIDGDSLSLSVASASIVAKVTRDNIMCQYHEKYPQYGFDRHKGYGTKEHMRKIKEYGPCKIHRRSFYPISLLEEIGYV